MARKPRMQFAGALYHVTTRGNRREVIVKDEQDYGMLQKMLIEAMNWTGVCLYSWCLMPNHVHVLVETPDGNVSAFMQRWLTRYARYFNWRHKLVGHVFQGRYKAKLCQKESYFKELIRYIHLNPYRVKRPGFVGASGWKWSSHRYYVGERAPAGTQAAIEKALGYFGGTLAVARKNYAQFLADGLKEGNWEDFYEDQSGEVLGDKDFQEDCREKSGVPSHRSELGNWTVEELLCAAERHLKIERGELTGPSQKRRLSRARQAIVYVGRVCGQISMTELAQAFRRDISAISQMMRRREAVIKGSQEVRLLIEVLGKGERRELSICQA